jgi:hypothetical protein
MASSCLSPIRTSRRLARDRRASVQPTLGSSAARRRTAHTCGEQRSEHGDVIDSDPAAAPPHAEVGQRGGQPLHAIGEGHRSASGRPCTSAVRSGKSARASCPSRHLPAEEEAVLGIASLLLVPDRLDHGACEHVVDDGRGDDHLHVRFLSRVARMRARGSSAGSAPGITRLLIEPSPSTVMVATSPGRSGGGSSAPRHPNSSARQPAPQVSEPRTSPGRTQVPREAYAVISSRTSRPCSPGCPARSRCR